MSYAYECPEGHTNTQDNNRTVFCIECQDSYPKQSLNDPQALAKLRTSADYLSPKRWSASHDLIHFLTPYEHFNNDPWEDFKIYKNAVESLPSTQATFKFKDVHPSNYHTNRQELFGDLIGAWRMDNRDSLPTVWVNPYYGQYDELDWEPDEPKVEYCLRVGLLGKWTVRDLSTRFGNYPSSIARLFKRRGMTFGEVQAYGRKRLANTVMAAKQWGGHDIQDCAKAIDVPNTTLLGWIDRYGDFDAEPPSSKPFSNDWG